MATEGKSQDEKTPKGTFKSTVFMITQQLEYITKEDDMSWESYFTSLCNNSGALDYAWIIHDKDTYIQKDLDVQKKQGLDMTGKQVGGLKPQHVHIVVRMKNPTRLSTIAKAFAVKEQYVEVETNPKKKRFSFQNKLSYLTHRTSNSSMKYQYDFSEVHYSFADGRTYAQHMDSTKKSVKKAEKRNEVEDFNLLLAKYLTGNLSYDAFKAEAQDPLTKVNFAKTGWLKQLNELQDYQEAEQFFKLFTQPQRTIWLYGDTGSGKSLAAKKMAELFAKKRFPNEPALGNSYKALGSSRGPFEGYNSAIHVIVLDDFRPSKQVTYDDMLRMFDPNAKGPRQMPARYYDRIQATSAIIVTSPYNPAEFAYRLLGKWHDIIQRIYVGTLSPDGRTGTPPLGDAHDAELYDLRFDDIEEMNLVNGRRLYKKSDSDEMLDLYKQGLDGVVSARTKNGGYYWCREEYLKTHKQEPWNLIESPSQLMRRVHTYEVSRDKNGRVGFTRMIPIMHDDGYCEYERELFKSDLSLEEVWECRSLEENPFDLSTSLPAQDQAMDQFHYDMLKHSRTFLYIHGLVPNRRRLDESTEIEIETRVRWKWDNLVKVSDRLVFWMPKVKAGYVLPAVNLDKWPD